MQVGLLELTLSQSHLSGENAAQFYADVAIHTVPNIVPHCTYYTGWTEAVWIQGLPKASTHDQRRSNRTPYSLNPNLTGLTP